MAFARAARQNAAYRIILSEPGLRAVPKMLSEEQVEQFRRDGYVSPIRLLDPDGAARYRRCFEAAEASMGGRLKGAPRNKFYLRYPWAHELATTPALLDAVEDLIGPDIMLYHNMAWVKEKGDQTYVSWHQDNTYFGHEPCEVLTAWIALSPATLESGCVRVLPGTHRLGQLPLTMPDTSESNLLSSGMQVDFDTDSVAPVPLVLQPGEISLHHAFLIHGSPPNVAAHRRLGVTFIYHSPALGQRGSARTSALLVRGEDRYGHFDHERPPIAADDPDTIAHHEQAVAMYRKKIRELGNVTLARFD